MHRSELDPLSRRAFIIGAVAVSIPAVACSRSEPTTKQGSSTATTALTPVAMTVYRDPDCPCCEDWAELAARAGFAVKMIDDPDMAAVKKRLGVPEGLASCHTAQVAGLVFEGHVPIAHVKQLMESNDAGLAGLAVPGMPPGSPGMEMPDGSKEPFDVIGFDKNGQTRVFARA